MSNSTFSSKDEREVDEIVRIGGESAVFSDRFLGDAAGRYIFTALTRAASTCPKSVEAKGCYMGLEAAMSLAEMLKSPSCRMESLSLEWNSLGSFENGIVEVSTALALNSSLTSLDLRNNNIGPNGGATLARGLRDNRTMLTLDLRWNEIGNPGGLAFKDLLVSASNNVIKSIKLSGNKMSDVILTEVEDLMARVNKPGAMTSSNIADEYHVIRGKNEELQRDIAKMSAELQAAKNELKTKDASFEIVKAKSKSDASSRVENLEKQMSDSAATVSLLEIEVLREKERADRLQNSLMKEQREKDAALSSLRVEKEAAASKKMSSERDKSQLATSLKITEETLEVLRSESDTLRMNFATREKELLMSLSERERKLAEARNNEDKARTELSRLEVALGDAQLKEKMAEERAAQTGQLLDECIEDRTKQVEEARKSGLDAVETVRAEMMGRVKSAEQRALDAEAKQLEADQKVREAESRAAELSVNLEQKLSEQASKLKGELASMQSGELRELTDALDVVKAQRESQDVTMSQLAADLESTRELRQRESDSAKRTIEKLNKNLSEALKEARRERGLTSDLKLELASLKRQVEPFKKKVETSEAERKRAEEFRTRDVEQLQGLLSNEREERAREAIGYQRRLDDCNETLRSMKEKLSEQRTTHMKEFHRLEKGMVAAVQAIFNDRKSKMTSQTAKTASKSPGGEENKQPTPY